MSSRKRQFKKITTQILARIDNEIDVSKQSLLQVEREKKCLQRSYIDVQYHLEKSFVFLFPIRAQAMIFNLDHNPANKKKKAAIVVTTADQITIRETDTHTHTHAHKLNQEYEYSFFSFARCRH